MKSGIVKLGDLGIAKTLANSADLAKTQIGTPYYLSPEICCDKPYGRKSDMWAAGVCLYEMLTLTLPFTASDLPRLVTKILAGSFPPLPSRISDPVRRLVDLLLSKDPRNRPSVTNVLKSPLLKDRLSRFLTQTLASREFGQALQLARNGALGGPPPNMPNPNAANAAAGLNAAAGARASAAAAVGAGPSGRPPAGVQPAASVLGSGAAAAVAGGANAVAAAVASGLKQQQQQQQQQTPILQLVAPRVRSNSSSNGPSPAVAANNGVAAARPPVGSGQRQAAPMAPGQAQIQQLQQQASAAQQAAQQLFQQQQQQAQQQQAQQRSLFAMEKEREKEREREREKERERLREKEKERERRKLQEREALLAAAAAAREAAMEQARQRQAAVSVQNSAADERKRRLHELVERERIKAKERADRTEKARQLEVEDRRKRLEAARKERARWVEERRREWDNGSGPSSADNSVYESRSVRSAADVPIEIYAPGGNSNRRPPSSDAVEDTPPRAMGGRSIVTVAREAKEGDTREAAWVAGGESSSRRSERRADPSSAGAAPRTGPSATPAAVDEPLQAYMDDPDFREFYKQWIAKKSGSGNGHRQQAPDHTRSVSDDRDRYPHQHHAPREQQQQYQQAQQQGRPRSNSVGSGVEDRDRAPDRGSEAAYLAQLEDARRAAWEERQALKQKQRDLRAQEAQRAEAERLASDRQRDDRETVLAMHKARKEAEQLERERQLTEAARAAHQERLALLAQKKQEQLELHQQGQQNRMEEYSRDASVIGSRSSVSDSDASARREAELVMAARQAVLDRRALQERIAKRAADEANEAAIAAQASLATGMREANDFVSPKSRIPQSPSRTREDGSGRDGRPDSSTLSATDASDPRSVAASSAPMLSSADVVVSPEDKRRGSGQQLISYTTDAVTEVDEQGRPLGPLQLALRKKLGNRIGGEIKATRSEPEPPTRQDGSAKKGKKKEKKSAAGGGGHASSSSAVKDSGSSRARDIVRSLAFDAAPKERDAAARPASIPGQRGIGPSASVPEVRREHGLGGSSSRASPQREVPASLASMLPRSQYAGVASPQPPAQAAAQAADVASNEEWTSPRRRSSGVLMKAAAGALSPSGTSPGPAAAALWPSPGASPAQGYGPSPERRSNAPLYGQRSTPDGSTFPQRTVSAFGVTPSPSAAPAAGKASASHRAGSSAAQPESLAETQGVAMDTFYLSADMRSASATPAASPDVKNRKENASFAQMQLSFEDTLSSTEFDPQEESTASSAPVLEDDEDVVRLEVDVADMQEEILRALALDEEDADDEDEDDDFDDPGIVVQSAPRAGKALQMHGRATDDDDDENELYADVVPSIDSILGGLRAANLHPDDSTQWKFKDGHVDDGYSSNSSSEGAPCSGAGAGGYTGVRRDQLRESESKRGGLDDSKYDSEDEDDDDDPGPSAPALVSKRGSYGPTRSRHVKQPEY
jgi:hypothetical protein